MCLTSKNYSKKERNIAMKPLVAKKDFKVYKILQNGLKAPWRDFHYEPGIHYYQDKKLKPIKVDSVFGYYFKIEEGLHCFKDKESARQYRDQYLNSTDEIFEMIIPKGSQYFIGKIGDIATDNLIFPL